MTARGSSLAHEEAAAAALLKELRGHVRSTLARIDAELAESRKQARQYAKLRAQTRKEAVAWLKAHPDEAQAISDLFSL